MKCSVVIPCHNEEENVGSLYEGLCAVVGESDEYEFILIDDGSTDRTLERIKKLREKDRRVKFISLMTNYGQQKAIFAAFPHCRGEFTLTMDADLQHPPRYIPLFLEAQEKTGADLVLGRRRGEQRGFLKNLFSRAFYRLFHWGTRVEITPATSDFRLYTRRAIKVLSALKEQQPFLPAMAPHLRLKTTVIDYELGDRWSGETTYTLGRLIRMAWNAFLRFSSLPAQLSLMAAGFGIALAVFEVIQYLYLRFFTEHLVPGQTELMVFLSLSVALILFMLSLLYMLINQVLEILRGVPSHIVAEMELD